MKSHREWLFHGCAIVAVVILGVGVCAGADMAEVERLSKTGETLGVDVGQEFPLREQRVSNDTGINVLVDLSHQANFFMIL